MHQCLEEVQAAFKHCRQIIETVPQSGEVKPTPLPFTRLPPFLGANRQEICGKCLEKLKVAIVNIPRREL